MYSRLSFFISLTLAFTLFFGITAYAQVTPDSTGLDATAGAAGLLGSSPKDVPTLIGNVIGTLLSMVGVLFFLLMLYGGVLWMTARGNEDQTTKSMHTIIAASIGIVIVLASYALTNFVFESVGGSDEAPAVGAPAGGGNAGAQACPQMDLPVNQQNNSNIHFVCLGKNVNDTCVLAPQMGGENFDGICRLVQGGDQPQNRVHCDCR